MSTSLRLFGSRWMLSFYYDDEGRAPEMSLIDHSDTTVVRVINIVIIAMQTFHSLNAVIAESSLSDYKVKCNIGT